MNILLNENIFQLTYKKNYNNNYDSTKVIMSFSLCQIKYL